MSKRIDWIFFVCRYRVITSYRAPLCVRFGVTNAGVEVGGRKRLSLGQESQRFHAGRRMRFYGLASGKDMG